LGRLRQRAAGFLTTATLLVLGASGCLASGGVEKERAEMPEAASVSRAGVRYEAIVWGRARGLAQNGGYIAAVDTTTGKELWILRVYAAAPDDGKEADKRDVFITELRLAGDGRHLRVTNERGASFRVDTRTRKVTPLRW